MIETTEVANFIRTFRMEKIIKSVLYRLKKRRFSPLYYMLSDHLDRSYVKFLPIEIENDIQAERRPRIEEKNG